MDMQKLILVGRAVKDAETFDTKKGKKFAVFTLAVNRYLGKEKGQEATFYDCVMFNDKTAEKVTERVKKGDVVLVEGRPDAEAYLSKENEPKAKLKVIVDDWQALK
jgi:single-strand DNA-binding protein